MSKNNVLCANFYYHLSTSNMDKIVVSAAEVAQTEVSPEIAKRLEAKLPPAVPAWAKWAMSPLVLVLPLLCLVAIVLRVAMRNLPPRTRQEWTSLLATLLTASGLITSVAAVLSFSFAPLPSVVGAGLYELDERTEFPALPTAVPMSAKEVAESLKPLVAVVSPAARSWFSHAEMPSASFGAGTLLQATADGYLFVTARHVIDGPNWNNASSGSRGLITMASGGWGGADVVARHRNLDLVLLWVPRESGIAKFAQPLAKRDEPQEGENVFVIGHPEGLRFTLSTGIISRMRGSTIQISAPVSPGNSGGPVFDSHGNLVGIVTSMVDKHGDPNAENLNFAVSAAALLQDDGWDFTSSGRRRLSDYIAQDEKLQKTVPVEGKN
jgi:S1-C subfamily serine protease